MSGAAWWGGYAALIFASLVGTIAASASGGPLAGGLSASTGVVLGAAWGTLGYRQRREADE